MTKSLLQVQSLQSQLLQSLHLFLGGDVFVLSQSFLLLQENRQRVCLINLSTSRSFHPSIALAFAGFGVTVAPALGTSWIARALVTCCTSESGTTLASSCFHVAFASKWVAFRITCQL